MLITPFFKSNALCQNKMNPGFPQRKGDEPEKSSDEMNAAGVNRGYREKPGRENGASGMQVFRSCLCDGIGSPLDRATRELEGGVLCYWGKNSILGQGEIHAFHPALLSSMPGRMFF
jgi:hypothetical protein